MMLEGNPTSFPIPLFSAGGNPHILFHVFRDISIAQCGGSGDSCTQEVEAGGLVLGQSGLCANFVSKTNIVSRLWYTAV